MAASESHAAPAEPELPKPGLVPAPTTPAPSRRDWIATDAEGDRDSLFGALRTRLRESVGEPLDANRAPAEHTMNKIRTAVLDCESALGQLQEMVEADDRRQHLLEQQVAESLFALTDSKDQLAKAEAERVRYLASHDALTSLPNQRYFNDQLDAALVRARLQKHALALFYIDLDDFKGVNDQHGHIIGDELLRVVAMRLMRAVRTDDLVARVGGDEFACLLVRMPTSTQLVHLACKLFDAVSAPLRIGELALTIRPSIGIGVWSQRITTSTALIEIADAAMYSAKQQRCGYAISEDSRAGTAGDALTRTAEPPARRSAPT